MKKVVLSFACVETGVQFATNNGTQLMLVLCAGNSTTHASVRLFHWIIVTLNINQSCDSCMQMLMLLLMEGLEQEQDKCCSPMSAAMEQRMVLPIVHMLLNIAVHT